MTTDNENNQPDSEIISEQFCRERINNFIKGNNIGLNSSFSELIEINTMKIFEPYIVDINILSLQRTLQEEEEKGLQYQNVDDPIGIDQFEAIDIPYTEKPSNFSNHVSTKILSNTVSTFDCETCGSQGTIECSECNGHGKFRCSKCKGEKKIRCEKGFLSGCGGSGYRKCDRCSGKGFNREITAQGYMADVNCYLCAGKGETPCSKCHRTGLADCDNCSANGFIKCNKCNGHGELICNKCDGEKYFQRFVSITDEYISEITSKIFKEYGDSGFIPSSSLKKITGTVEIDSIIFDKTTFQDQINLPKITTHEASEYILSVIQNKLGKNSNNHKSLYDCIKSSMTITALRYIEVIYKIRSKSHWVIIDLKSDKVLFDSIEELINLQKLEKEAIHQITKKSIIYPLQRKAEQKSNCIILNSIIYTIWMDGIVDEKEKQLFQQFLDAVDLTDSQKENLLESLNNNRISLIDLKKEFQNYYEKELIAIVSWMFICIDEEIAESESIKYLELIKILGIKDYRIDDLKKIALREIRLFKRGDFSLGRLRIEGARDTSFTIIEAKQKTIPIRTMVIGWSLILTIISAFYFIPRLIFNENPLLLKNESLKKAIESKSLNEVLILESEIRSLAIKPNSGYTSDLELYPKILKLCIENKDKENAKKIYEIMVTKNILNLKIMDSFDFVQDIKAYHLLK
ncbi:MAG: hypothetical protein IPL26_26255 [Leptospiraceae bacterium]|nr:hypothetical protein [Leptospiraceae bacterium]